MAGVDQRGVLVSNPSDGLGQLTDEQRQALASLLDHGQRLCSLARQLHERADEVAVMLREYADSVVADALRLAAVPLVTGAGTGRELGLVSFEIERHTEKLWSIHLQARSEKAEAHYGDGPSRSVALANGLVLLARTVLDQAPNEDAGERQLEEKLGDLMAEYDDSLCPLPIDQERAAAWQAAREKREADELAERLATEGPEPSFHGEHID